MVKVFKKLDLADQ